MTATREIELSRNAQRVLASRYLRKDADGNRETPEELFQRVAHKVSQAELAWSTWSDAQFWEERFYELLCDLKFLPNSPTLMNAGIPCNQLSACFVLPVEDSLADIFSTLKLAALIQQSGGGTGFNFSHLRGKNTVLQNTQGTSSGPVSFMKIFDAATEHVKQGGKRRGANMGVLNINHPDIEEFIKSKRSEHHFHNFNLSVGITDSFMHAAARGDDWELMHPDTGAVAKKVNARKLWDSIIESAWQSGDPGLIFLDTINQHNPTPLLGKIESTNPCGEVPLLPYESCNLGSLNLTKFLQPQKTFDWELLEQAVHAAIRFLDNVIEVNHYLSPEMKEMVLGNRKIGLGVMGWAEALCTLEIPYDSEEAIELAGQLMKFISEASKTASMNLAKQRGVFKNWPSSIYYHNRPIRNATCTSIAPTGSISIIADTSPSIEPFFALAYQRHPVLENETLQEINKPLINYLTKHRIDQQEIMEAITTTGTLAGVTCISSAEKKIFKTALEINPEWHLKHQIAFQKFTDNAVSKTINLPEAATRNDISSIYEKAWRQGLKGITVFRYNSKPEQIMHRGITRDVKSCKVCTE